jgi:hypothetical protein
MKEEFKKWGDRYNIYPDGRVFDTKKNDWARLYTVGSGYYAIPSITPKKSYDTIHRIVAELYIDNPLLKPHVNHKDSNKKNNHMDNLEWVYPRENSIHFHQTKKTKYPTGVHINQNGVIYVLIQIDGVNTNIGRFDTIEEAAVAYQMEAIRQIERNAGKTKRPGKKANFED